MSIQNCMGCLRWFVFILNLLFWLMGLGTLGVGLWLRFDPDVANYMKVHDGLERFYVGVYILIAIGAVMTVLGFLGCCGALRQSQCLLVAFFILLVLVFCAQLACGILAYTHQDTVKHYITNSMYDTVSTHYGSKPAFTEIFDSLQQSMECCGVKSYKDWLNSYYSNDVSSKPTELGIGASQYGRVPQSCCNEKGMRTYPVECGTAFDEMPLNTYAAFLHDKGCGDALYERVYRNLDIVIGFAIGIGALQLIGMVLSMLLCCYINYEKEEDRKHGGYY